MADEASVQDVGTGEQSTGTARLDQTSSLADPQWAAELLANPDVIPVINASSLMLGTTELTPDHMFTAFLRHNLLLDLVCLYNSREREVYTLYHLGTDTCGHPGIVHGGLTSAMVDETFGALLYMLKKHSVIEPGPAFTAHLEVDFRAPIPAGIEVLCKCWLESTERRKIWVRSQVVDKPGGTVFAEGKALFVNARKDTVDFEHMAPKAAK